MTSTTTPGPTSAPGGSVTDRFRAARDVLHSLRTDYDGARAAFEWPRFEHFNFALDWFDHLASDPATADREALVLVDADGPTTRRTFAQLSRRSDQVANWFLDLGMRRGDRVMLMLNNQVELWETMLACIKLGAVICPTTVVLGPADLAQRAHEAQVSWVVANPVDAAKFDQLDAELTVLQVGDDGQAGQQRHPTRYWREADSHSETFTPTQPTAADETLLLYFTSGSTSRPKLVEHTHTSYPVGHLTTMYFNGLEPGDVHLNIAQPGWAKHAYSSFFTPWIAAATVFQYNYARFDAGALMELLEAEGVTSFCAPPTVWRMLIQADLSRLATPPKKLLAAGEPLNPEVIAQVERAWGSAIRDGFGQTETTAQICNSPGQAVRPGSMGRPMPGVDVVLVDPATGQIGDTGEICLRLDPHPVGLTRGYLGDDEKNAEAFRDGLYHTGDLAQCDADGYYTYIGRADDVFKASDFRLSPFELESVVIQHPAVAEVAVVPSPDPLRLAVPKAYVALAEGHEPDAATAESILAHCRENLAPYKRIRRLEFHDLPKTVSGKIRRVDLRSRETDIHAPDGGAASATQEFADVDFPSLRG